MKYELTWEDAMTGVVTEDYDTLDEAINALKGLEGLLISLKTFDDSKKVSDWKGTLLVDGEEQAWSFSENKETVADLASGYLMQYINEGEVIEVRIEREE